MESKTVLLIIAFLSIIAIGGTLLYFYLRQEQVKVIPKDIYNQARDEFYTRKNRWRHNPTIASLIFSRLLIFYSTFVVVVALSILVMGIIDGGQAAAIIRLVLLSIVGSPLIVLIFPIGITALFEPNGILTRSFEEVLVGYVLYLVVCSLGIFAKDRRAFTIIYMIFITLLIMNIIGCSRIDIVL